MSALPKLEIHLDAKFVQLSQDEGKVKGKVSWLRELISSTLLSLIFGNKELWLRKFLNNLVWNEASFVFFVFFFARHMGVLNNLASSPKIKRDS